MIYFYLDGIPVIIYFLPRTPKLNHFIVQRHHQYNRALEEQQRWYIEYTTYMHQSFVMEPFASQLKQKVIKARGSTTLQK